MLINNVKITENRIVAIVESNKKNIIKLDELNLYDNTPKNSLDFILEDKNYSDETKNKKIEELFKMVDLPLSLLNRKINTLSESEKIKLYFAKKLLNNLDTIVIDDFFKFLDLKNKNKIIKILIKLKKYHNKTIYIYTNDLNNIFEFIDDILYVKGNKTIYNNKYDFFKENNEFIPEIVHFVNLLKNKCYNIKYKDSINELIKEIYREMR